MSIQIDRSLLSQIIESDVRLSTYFSDIKISDGWRGYQVDVLDTPTIFLEIILAKWSENLEVRLKGVDSEDDYQLKREINNLDEFKGQVENLTSKLKNKARSLQDVSYKLKGIFETKLGERFWIYKKGTPYLVKEMSYYPKDSNRDRAELVVRLKQNSMHSTSTPTISFDTDDMRTHKRDPIEMLKGKGFVFETDELYKQYRLDEKDYLDKRTWQNEQVVHNGVKYINDNMYYEGKSSGSLHHSMMSDFNAMDELCEVPVHCIVYCFNLSDHTFEWLNTRGITKYKYNPNIGKKLILPSEHKNLINILLSDKIEAIGSDIIEGKGAGTLILTKGKAGLGKTATAEIYSETKQLPMYSVHSGQLGTDGDSIERKLKEIFSRTERWGCILLIDEADVYIRKRGDDINHNAIVATFLRTMEYFTGVLFMTTNRTNDVDEAIESRCIAVLKYSIPTGKMSADLWELFINQYELDVTKEAFKEVSKKMNELSGRDIKNICMLVSRYSQGMDIKQPDFDIFKLCATFRGKYSIGKEH